MRKELVLSIQTFLFFIDKPFHKQTNKLSIFTCYSHSAGVGRTGTLVTIDQVLDQIKQEKVVDIAGIVRHLRSQRMKMVQNSVGWWVGGWVIVYVYRYVKYVWICSLFVLGLVSTRYVFVSVAAQ